MAGKQEDVRTMGREGIIRQTPDGYETVFERVLAHPVEKVWAMLTEPQEILKWYTRTELEPRVGGRIVEHHDHVGLSMPGLVTRFEPPKVFEHTWWEDEAAGTIAGSIEWELFPSGSGTRLVTTNRFKHLRGAEGALAGWHISLDVMEAVLDGADPSAHAPPQGVFQEGRLTQTAPGRGRWADREKLEEHYHTHVEALDA